MKLKWSIRDLLAAFIVIVALIILLFTVKQPVPRYFTSVTPVSIHADDAKSGSMYTTAQTEQEAKHGKVVMIFIDRIGLSDLNAAETPNIDGLLKYGAIGLMTVNTGGTRSQRDAYLTMGAGTRVIGSDKSSLGFGADESYQGSLARELYFQMTGNVPGHRTIVNLGFVQAARNNARRPYTVTIGALGTALREAGIHAAVIGNCDTAHDYKRCLVSFLMDDQGLIPNGIVDKSSLTEDYGRPFGIRTEYGVLLQQTDDLWDNSDVIAIQLGDTSRAEDFRYEAVSALTEQYRQMAIEESDAFIGQIIQRLDLAKDVLLIVTPLGPAKDLAENNRLTPVIAAGRGFSKGLLMSASTRRPGVITNLDIGASVLDYFNIPHQPGQLGAAVRSHPSQDGPMELQSFNRRLTEIFNQRGFLIRSYVTAQILLLLTSLTAVFFYKKYLDYAKACMFFLMAVPISYLILTVFHQRSLAGSFLLSWLLAAVVTGLLYLRKLDAIVRAAILCFTSAGLIIVDQLTGARLIQGSPLGYDVISGARFYGIGNEYMGVLIGAVCTGTGIVYELLDKRAEKFVHGGAIILFALTMLTMAHPAIGANAGGTIAAAAAFSAFFILMYKDGLRLKYLLPVGVFITAITTGSFLFDSLRAADSQSHMGQTVSLLRQNGIIELFYIIKRKIEMNFKLFRYTIWTRVFLLSLLTIVLLIFRPVGIFRDITDKYPKAVKGIASALIGCIVAFLVNDSGIVAAGTSMIYIAPPVLLIVMDHLSKSKTDLYGFEL